MSRAKLNIWLRYSNCNLITDCWRTDLVVKSCCGSYLVDTDSTIIDQLREKYPELDVQRLPNYQGETRIKLQPAHGKFINHVELDVPPGCYLVWTRVCHGRNEETNKVMVIADCAKEVCVNLILNAVRTCGNEFIHPFAVAAVQLNVPRQEIGVAVNAILKVAEKPKREFLAELGQRLEEVAERQDERLVQVIKNIIDIAQENDPIG